MRRQWLELVLGGLLLGLTGCGDWDPPPPTELTAGQGREFERQEEGARPRE